MVHKRQHDDFVAAALKIIKDYQDSGTVEKWVCELCDYVYDPAVGCEDIPPGTVLEDLPDNWEYPECLTAKDRFVPESQAASMKKCQKAEKFSSKFSVQRNFGLFYFLLERAKVKEKESGFHPHSKLWGFRHIFLMNKTKITILFIA